MSEDGFSRAVLDALPQAICAIDETERFAYANAAFWKFAGVEPGDCPIGSPLRDVVRMLAYRGHYGAGDPEAQVEAILAINRSRFSRRQVATADGTRTLELVSMPLPGGGFVNTAHDITALIRAREEQAARARVLETTLTRLRGGVARFDENMRLTVTNPAYESLLGLTGGAVHPGMTHRDIIGLLDEIGEFTANGEAGAVRVTMERDRAFGSTRERRRPSGDVLRFDTQPMPDRGSLVEVTDITALKRAEDEAKRRAAMLDGMLAALPHGVVVYGPDRRVQMFNAAYERMMGGAPVHVGDLFDDAVARRLASGEYDEAMAARVLRRFGQLGEDVPPMRRARPNGTVLENSMARMPDGGRIAVFTDVTALHQAQEAARQRAALLNGVLEALPHGVCVYGPDRRVAMFNDSYTRIMEGAEISIGDHIDDVVARRVALGEFSPEYALKTIETPNLREAEKDERIRQRPNGTVISIRGAPLPDGGHISVVTDVTALHRAEAEVRRRSALQEAMLGTIRHGIIMYGPDRRLLATNAKTAALTGMPPEGLVPGKLMDDLIAEQVARGQIAPAQAAEMLAYDRRKPLRYSRMRPDGRVLDTESEPTPDGGYVITYSDVTEDRAIRAELERARAQAEAASEAKSRFLATMSHELRTPLNAVIGLSEALGLERDPAQIADYAAMINEAGRQLLTLVDDILDVARSETGALGIADGPVCSALVIAEAIAAVEPAAELAGLTLETELAEGLPALRGDARRLRQVLDKLLSNALKFTPSGGRVTVSATGDLRGLTIRVADTGIGIPAHERDRMFEPFTQLDSSLARRFQGSGLGLHLARTLAIALGGTLTLDAPDGPGTVAVLRFPAERMLPTAEPMPEAAAAMPA
jgi:signal transduction histidine kinase